MTVYTYGDGRIWMQTNKFQPFKLLLPYGLTGATDPRGALAAVREPSPSTRRKSVIVDIIQGEPGLPEFQIETRLAKTLNYLMGLNCKANFQVHLGACGRPDNYGASEVGLLWHNCHRGDLTIDRLSKIEGDETPIAIQVPFSAEIGPTLIDFDTEFVSARTILESEAANGIKFLESECLEDCRSQEAAGENGYLVTGALAGSPNNIANVWYTIDGGQTWAETSERPFAGGEDILGPVINGTRFAHRIIVARGTTDADDPAEIAYADVTVMGTTDWVNVDVGAVDGQYITSLVWLDYMHLYAGTDDGYVYKSADGGATWTAVMSTAVNDIRAIAGHGTGQFAGNIWIGGDSNTLYRSEDFGTTWTAVTGPVAGQDIDAIAFTPDGTVFVGYGNGAIYGSYDNGRNWTLLPAQGITPTEVKAIVNWGDDVIWAAVNLADGSGRVVRSTDGGASFKLWNLNLPDNDGLNSMDIVDPNIVFVVGDPVSGTAFVTKTTTQVTGV